MMNTLSFLRERKSSFFGENGVTNLQRSLTDLFGAGSETSATTLLYAILYMIKYPEIQVIMEFQMFWNGDYVVLKKSVHVGQFLISISYQEKVYAEIEVIVGKDSSSEKRTVGLDDRSTMPYTDATLHEILRHSCLVYAIPHSTLEDVTLSSYTLPR